eukprot:4570984-Prymnesium_polylepis.1
MPASCKQPFAPASAGPSSGSRSASGSPAPLSATQSRSLARPHINRGRARIDISMCLFLSKPLSLVEALGYLTYGRYEDTRDGTRRIGGGRYLYLTGAPGS